MAFGDVDVVFDAFAPYSVTFTRETPQGTLFFTATVKFNADGYAPETVETAFQEWLDDLQQSIDFPVHSATRAATGVQTITPSA